ncbi:hypothetical protein [Antrihabitans cavernicola]|uniref:Uncharacterized protein n=1 Tax=Antrihabitans cavernicola TaxID=2495913 RepID=A0A5A7SGK7_9NOCA|nr:hypothetical protein [Spelaeibacter cavernicola]KAA0024734.1 hypothetical protein FOY51_02010 [Spelaeibacter cavernicola]
MKERVRIAAEPSAIDYAARFGYKGRTLASYIEEFGGWEGEVGDPYGSRQVVSLEPLRGVDPNLFLKMMFIVPKVQGDDFPILYGDAVVLKEYELPEGTVVPR